MQEPRSRIVNSESNGNLITCNSGAHNITKRGVNVVIHSAACAADDMEGVLRKNDHEDRTIW